MCTDGVKKIKNVVREAVALKQELLSTCGSVCPPVRLLVDNATPYQLAVTLQEQGECQGCITPEGSMLQSRLLRAGEAANLFLHTHTQEPYVYENAKRMIDLAHTSGGSGLGKSAAGLQNSAAGARILNGRMLNGRLNASELRSWVEGLKL